MGRYTQVFMLDLGVPPDQAWPAPCKVHCSATIRSDVSLKAVRLYVRPPAATPLTVSARKLL
jgi:hypothetical protein